MKKYLLLSILVFITFYPIYVQAQNEKDLLSLNVQGTAQIKRSDVAIAREEAIQDALEKAILEAASKILSIPAKDENFQLVKSVLVNDLKKYSEYVRIKEFLQSRTKLVKNIFPSRFEWQHAHFEIEIYGNAQSLANELEENGGCILEIKKKDHDKEGMICWQT